MFLYADGEINWADSHGFFAQVGLNAGDGVNFAVVNGSGTADLLNIDTTSNVDVPGIWMFRVDQQSVILPSGKALYCHNYVF